MAYQIIWKRIKGHGPYAYVYNSFRDPVTHLPRQKFIKYLGKNIPFGTKIAHVKQKKTPAPWKTRIRLKGKQGRKLRRRNPKDCMLPTNQKCRHKKCIKWACEYYQPITKEKKRREKGI